MPMTFRPWTPEQTALLPPSPSDWLSDDHQVQFLLDLMDELDLSAIVIPAQSKDPRGEKGFDPRMMAMLLFYAYCVGIVSSRKIERACYEDLAFRVLTANQQPDHSRISEFRRRNLDALKGLLFSSSAGEMPTVMTMDAGYWSEDNTKLCADQEIDASIATGRRPHVSRCRRNGGCCPEMPMPEPAWHASSHARRDQRSTPNAR